jgi:hypothetical protein
MSMSEAQIEARRKSGRAINSPDGMALRMARMWPTIDPVERERVVSLLRPLVAPELEPERRGGRP